jgi:hypothetical protein
MKKKRAQGRKRGVEIPPSPELAEHADRIRALGRQTFDGVIEIGQRLVRCRKLLKTQRVWLAWLEAEFGWSRRTADRFIDLFRAKDKVRNLRSLGVGLSGLYLLAKASPEVVEGFERHVEAGHRVSLAEIEQRMRADPKRAAINTTPSPAENGTRRTFGSMPPPEAASKQPKLTAEDFEAARRRQLVDSITDLARELRPSNIEEAHAIVESVGARRRRDNFASAVAVLHDFLASLQRALNERVIEEPAPTAPTLGVICGGKDE